MTSTPPTPKERAALREKHHEETLRVVIVAADVPPGTLYADVPRTYADRNVCGTCHTTWPCLPLRLLDQVEALEAALAFMVNENAVLRRDAEAAEERVKALEAALRKAIDEGVKGMTYTLRAELWQALARGGPRCLLTLRSHRR